MGDSFDKRTKMNERIEKLAKKAGLLGRKFMFGQYYDDELTDEQKKFAELIVQECFKAAMIESKGHMNPIDLMNRMKEQVGVEE